MHAYEIHVQACVRVCYLCYCVQLLVFSDVFVCIKRGNMVHSNRIPFGTHTTNHHHITHYTIHTVIIPMPAEVESMMDLGT